MGTIQRHRQFAQRLQDNDPAVRKAALEELLLQPHISRENLRLLRAMADSEPCEECVLLLNFLFDVNKIHCEPKIASAKTAVPGPAPRSSTTVAAASIAAAVATGVTQTPPSAPSASAAPSPAPSPAPSASAAPSPAPSPAPPASPASAAENAAPGSQTAAAAGSETTATDEAHAQSGTTFGKFIQFYLRQSGPERLKWLKAVYTRHPKRGAELVARLFPNEKGATLRAYMLHLFHQDWPEQDMPLMVDALSAFSSSVRLAAMNGLIKRSPALFLAELPRLLCSGDVRMRTLAVRGLAQIDPEAGCAHLREMLLEGTYEERGLALASALIMPFETVKELLLHALSIESDPELLRMAALPFQINPDPESPFNLYQVMETAAPSKALLLSETSSRAIDALEAAEMLPDGREAFIRKLELWSQGRGDLRFVRETLLLFRDGAEEERHERLLEARRQTDNPRILSLFEKAGKAELPESIKKWVAMVLAPSLPTLGASIPTATAATPITPGASATSSSKDAVVATATDAEILAAQHASKVAFHEQDTETQILTIATWDQRKRHEARNHITTLLSDAAASPRVKAAALRAATRLVIDGFPKEALAALDHSESALLCAALDYLGCFALNDVTLELGRFLKSADARVRGTALRVLQKKDAAHAVAYLLNLLRGQAEDREAALSCLVHFDFSLVRDRLIELLLGNPNPELMNTCLLFFETNPDPANIPGLFRLEQAQIGPRMYQIREVRKRCIAELVRLGRLTAAEAAAREQEWAASGRRQEAEARRPQPYSTRFLRRTMQPWENIQTTSTDHAPTGLFARCLHAGKSLLGQTDKALALAGVGLAVLFFMVVRLVGFSAPEGDNGTRILPGFPLTTKVKISRHNTAPGLLSLQTTDNTRFLMPATDLSVEQRTDSNAFELTLIPRQQLPDGQVFARIFIPFSR